MKIDIIGAHLAVDMCENAHKFKHCKISCIFFLDAIHFLGNNVEIMYVAPRTLFTTREQAQAASRNVFMTLQIMQAM
jgi:hypothetical protein